MPAGKGKEEFTPVENATLKRYGTLYTFTCEWRVGSYVTLDTGPSTSVRTAHLLMLITTVQSSYTIQH